MLRLTLSLLMMHLAGSSLVATWKCEVASKWACSASGCQPNQLGIWNEIDFGRETYARCDRRGCDTYPASLSRSGSFAVIDLPGKGMTAKMAEHGVLFVEVATMGPEPLSATAGVAQSADAAAWG